MNLAAKARLASLGGKAKIWFTNKSGEKEDGAKREEVIVRSMEEHAKEDTTWNELKEFANSHIVECSVFAAFVLFGIFCIFNAFGFLGSTDLKIRSVNYENTVNNHCQFLENQSLEGTEGTTSHPNATLSSLLIVVRHGDRFEFPHVSGDCQPLNELEQKVFDEYSEAMERQKILESLSIPDSLKELAQVKNDSKCVSMMLTPRGAAQEFSAGRFLFNVYKNSPLFNSSVGPIHLVVVSSDKQRIIASGVALISGLMDQNQTKFSQPIDFKSLKAYNGCTEEWCKCENFINIFELARKEREGLFRIEGTHKMKEMVDLIVSNSTSERHLLADPNAIIDFLVAGQVCQRKPLPCYSDGRCVSWNFLGDLIEYSNDRSSRIFKEELGVDPQFRVLSSYPILKSLALMSETDEKTMRIYPTHDMNIGSILKVLTNYGNFSDLQNYAARIVFEVYTTSLKVKMFRVLHNGLDVTSSLSFCTQLEYDLCPMADLQKFLDQDIFKLSKSKSFNETCYSNF